MRISITFDDETYKQLKNIASRNNISIAETVRRYTCEMLNGQVSRDNVDLISRILRQELQAVLGRYFEPTYRIAGKNLRSSWYSCLSFRRSSLVVCSQSITA